MRPLKTTRQIFEFILKYDCEVIDLTTEEFQRMVLEEFKSIRNQFSEVNTQLSETNQIVKALMHRTDELDAKFDGLLNTTVTKTALAESESRITLKLDRMAGDLSFLLRKAVDHDDEIRELRRAK